MIVTQPGIIGQAKLANVSRYTGIDITRSVNTGDILHIRGEAGPTNAGPWTVFQELQVYGGPPFGGGTAAPINVKSQIPDDPNFVWGRLNAIDVIGSWDITPSIT